MSKAISIEIPDSVVSLWSSEKQLEKELSYFSVIELVREGKVSVGKACELLQLNRWEVMSLLTQYDVPTVNFSSDELHQQMKDFSQTQQ